MSYYRFNEEKKNSEQDSEALRRECFSEEEIKRLSQLRRDHAELADCLTSAEYQRLVFVRWLITRGKLSEHLA